MDDSWAAELRAAEVLGDEVIAQSSTGAVPGAGPAVVPADEGERIAFIVATIGKLKVDSAELWTAGGSPKTEALAAITGWAVTAKERDAAWAQVKV